MSRQPPRQCRKRNTPSPSPRRQLPPPQLKWLTTSRRSVSRRGVRDGSLQLDKLDDKLATPAPRTTPRKESEHVCVKDDKIGPSVSAGDPEVLAGAHLSRRPHGLQIRDKSFFTSKSPSPSSPSEESGLTWLNVPVVEAAILEPGRRRRRRLLLNASPPIVKREIQYSESHFPIPKRNKTSTRHHTPTVKQEIHPGILSRILHSAIQSSQAALPFPCKPRRRIMPPHGGRRGGRRGRPAYPRRSSPQETAPDPGSSSSSSPRPPHPYSTGKVFRVNVCPTCEMYTVKELDRPADSDPSTESLRARFRCRLCRNVFDLGIPLFDPRGTPGVTLYVGEDRFVPPVPPRATYPCPRCWSSGDSTFQGMVVYLRDEDRFACEPACPQGRIARTFREGERRSSRQSNR